MNFTKIPKMTKPDWKIFALFFLIASVLFFSGCGGPECSDFSLSASPNPVEAGQPVTLKISGPSVSQDYLSKANLYFQCGSQPTTKVSPSPNASFTCTFDQAGTYTGKAIATYEGEIFCTKTVSITVTQPACNPLGCSQLGWQCGSGTEPNCGQQLNCGNCTPPQVCQNHVCVGGGPTGCTSDSWCVNNYGPNYCCNTASGQCYYCGAPEPSPSPSPPEGLCPLTIIKGIDEHIEFFEDEGQKTGILKWTVVNSSDRSVKISSVQATGCSGGISCSFETTFPLTLASSESALLVEKVTASMPAQSMFKETGIKISYSDTDGSNPGEIDSSEIGEGQNVKVFVLNKRGDKFHSKLEYQDQNFCVGFDGLLGRTGLRSKPRVLFSWDWFDVGLNACDKESVFDDEFFYCDPVQFSIELARKLNEVSELGGDGVDSLVSFRAFLIKDNFSEDFCKDFAYYYTHSFFEVPEWFSSAATPWHKYFENPAKLQFEGGDLPDSGLYQIDLSFSFEVEDWIFFESGEPAAVVTVKFEKLHGAGVEVPDSPFYHLPFNGLVGTLREEGGKNRADYGLGYDNQNEPITISFAGADLIRTVDNDGGAIDGATEYSAGKEEGFDYLNLVKRGQLLSIKMQDRELLFSPSMPVPIVQGIESHDTIGEAFYYVMEGQDPVGSDKEYMTFWNGCGSSAECEDFYGNSLFDNRQDSRADVFAESCVPEDQKSVSFGFRWVDIANGQYLFQKSVFYLPLGQSYLLRNACSDGFSIFASNNGEASTEPSEAVSLSGTLQTVGSLRDIVELIGSSDVCVHSDLENDVYTFFWNEQRLQDSTRNAENAVEVAWNLNMENYDCEEE